MEGSMTSLVAVLGSVTPPGRLRLAVESGLAAARADTGVEAMLIDLAEYRVGFADGRPPEQLDDDTARLVEAIAAAGAVLFASPVYRATFTGALKNLIDHIPVEALLGKPCGIIAMGATQHHFLGVESHLRDVLAWFGAIVAPTGVYLTSADFADGQPTEGATGSVRDLAATVLRLREIAGQSLGPRPLAARR
jgi:FMN reductase